MRELMKARKGELNPFRLWGDWENELQNFFDWPQVKNLEKNKGFGFSPSCDFVDKDDHYQLSFDVPGVKKEDINVEMVDGGILISGERKYEHKENGYSEKSYGKFERFFSLPKEIVEDKVEGRVEDGVLSLRLPKKEQSSKRKIDLA